MISIQNEFPISKSIIQRVILGENYMSASLEGSKSNGGWLGPNLVTCEYLWPTWIPWFPPIHVLLTSQIPLFNNLVPLPEKVIQRMWCKAMIVNMRPLIWSKYFSHSMIYHILAFTKDLNPNCHQVCLRAVCVPSILLFTGQICSCSR